MRQASIKTRDELATVAHSMQGLTHLTLPEIDAVVDVVSRVIPAGNVPSVILSGLSRLAGRRVPASIINRDINLLLHGLEFTLDRMVYATFFAGPAMAIWGYQNLLKLAGKDPIDSFPEGTWQFYVDYALREDSARHANETHGFDSMLDTHRIRLDQVDRLAAWLLAAIHLLHVYPDLLANEWHERVYTFAFADTFPNLYREWESQRPYARGQDAQPNEDYPHYRRRKFDEFLGKKLKRAGEASKKRWWDTVSQAEMHDLPAYQRQMSLLGYLEPGQYSETRVAMPLSELHIGAIHNRTYYLIPVCLPETLDPPDPPLIRAWAAAILHDQAASDASLIDLARVRRRVLPALKLNADADAALRQLRTAPILLNFDERNPRLPLAEIRQGERGIGDHALTVFDTGQTFVFDQSHIYFDGAWGAAFAEIMTNEALAWAVYLDDLPQKRASSPIKPRKLTFNFTKKEIKQIGAAPQTDPEASAETELVNLKSLLALRRLFKKRSEVLRLTVNDILILYRAMHGITYQPRPDLLAELDLIKHPAATATRKAMHDHSNPAVLIPVDASQRSPRDRLYPMNFEAPLHDLDLLRLHAQTLEALNAFEAGRGSKKQFADLQRTYLATLAGFGEVLNKTKEYASAGKSTSTASIQLLAHLPTPMQRWLDQIPGRFEVLNDLIKGREVFSNVGAVVEDSSLTRFISAKDDNDKKTLVWGVITDAAGVMRLSLRDFRPHVRQLHEIGRADLAGRIAQDYLESYATGLNRFVLDCRRITAGLMKA